MGTGRGEWHEARRVGSAPGPAQDRGGDSREQSALRARGRDGRGAGREETERPEEGWPLRVRSVPGPRAQAAATAEWHGPSAPRVGGRWRSGPWPRPGQHAQLALRVAGPTASLSPTCFPSEPWASALHRVAASHSTLLLKPATALVTTNLLSHVA